MDEAIRVGETYSPAEEQFNRRRRTLGVFVAPVVFVLMLFAPLPALSLPAHRMAAVLSMVVILWVTEALPAPITAVLGPMLAIVLHVAPARTALAPFADPVIFLFIGSFILAEAMFVHGVDKRIAFTALASPFVGASAARILIVYGAVGTVISMWISNTATTAMMFPIGLSIAGHVARSGSQTDPRQRAFAMSMMLMASFASSVAVGTPVGTPPNLIGIGMLQRLANVNVSFFQWMAIGMPIMVVLFVFLCAYFSAVGARGVRLATGSARIMSQELARLGRMTVGERNVLAAFGVTITLWMMPGIFAVAGLENDFTRAYAAAVPESVAAMVGAILLFILPVNWRARQATITWEQAARIDWGTILLFGGGMAMGELAFSTGLAEAMGRGLASALPSQTTVALTLLFTGFSIVLSEATSNTAAATMIIPIAIAVAQGAGVRPIEPALGAILGASMGFMMPISTPPNAIVYSSGYVPITAMMRHGLVLDLVGFVVVAGFVLLLGPIVF